jgi:YD repeat-containing protein
MERDKLGVLTSITTPSGKWFRFENDEQHRIRRIESSTGRSVRYEYDARGRLAHLVDSSGKADAYDYDDRAEMIAASHEGGVPFLTMAYTQDGYVKTEALGDGKNLTSPTSAALATKLPGPSSPILGGC